MKYVEWIEPFGNSESPDIAVTCRIPVEDAIKYYKWVAEQHGKELSDEQALDSFIAVHWASVKEYDA